MAKVLLKEIVEGTNLFAFISVLDLKTQLTFVTIFSNRKNQVFLMSKKIVSFPSFLSLYLFSKNKSILKTAVKGIQQKLSLSCCTYKIQLEFIGTGYKFFYKDKLLYFILGYSHLIKLKLPNNCNVSINNNGKTLVLSHPNKYILGNIFYIIKSCRRLNIYKGKGIKNIFDQVKLKLGKTKSLKK